MIPAEKQPSVLESTSKDSPPVAAILELREQGLTVGDIARLFGVHSKAVSVMLKAKVPERPSLDI